MATRTTVHGFTVIYENNASSGIDYLRNDLDFDEAKVFFDQARLKGQAKFEDDEDRQFTLFYKNGIYTLVRR